VIRPTLRQFRTQALLGIAALIGAGIVLAITGAQLAHLYDTTVAGCTAEGDCPSVTSSFLRTDQVLQGLVGVALILVPGLVGLFWGAPLVARELENGTHQLVWTQGVTRRRWIAVKLGVGVLASMVLAGLFSLMVTWWFSPIDLVNMNQYTVFDQRSIVPIGYAGFAFALGVASGVLIRRTVPAMATTLVAFVAVRLGMEYGVRPYLFAPAHIDMPVSSATNLGFGPGAEGTNTFQAGDPTIPNAWVTSSQVVDKSGHAPTAQFIAKFCPNIGSPPQVPPGAAGAAGAGSRHSPANQTVFNDCIAQISARYHDAVTYQPGSRHWAFQRYETAIFLGLAVILFGFCFWWVRRRLS
jgi:ABC-2 family transporter protein